MEFIRSRRIVTPQGIREGVILTQNGLIHSVVSPGEIPAETHGLDVGNSVIMPGLVDTHVHINEPGRTDWEGFETATKAAAAGGVTTLIDMPLNSTPVTTSLSSFFTKTKSAEGKCWVDLGFWGGVVPDNQDQIQPMIEHGIFGFKSFLIHSGIDDFPSVSESDLDQVLPLLSEKRIPLLVHAETNAPRSPQSPHPDPRLYTYFLASRPPDWEDAAIRLLIDLCRKYRSPIHIVHLSWAGALPLIAQARKEGLPLTVETCPHYLSFSAEDIPDGRTEFKCCPPIREKRNREELWEGLKQGEIDFIVSDHSPSPPQLKEADSGDFLKAWGGISSLQLSLSAMWSQAHRRNISLSQLTQWMSTRPAEFAGLGKRKGKIAPGYDADLTVWDPEKKFIVDSSRIHHKHKLTPYTGETLDGIVQMTFLRGAKIYEHGRFPSDPTGKLLLNERIYATH
ncbi:MAG: allantoinase AllB [Elusimicrobia bacterium]|nr:allantoinase AllB [Elusimicrobiota bacterium]